MEIELGSQTHKEQFVNEIIKTIHENIWTMEVQKMDAQERLAKKKAYLDLIPKRMEEKFYPTARDGREDQKNTEDIIKSLEANIEKFDDMIGVELRKIEMTKRWYDKK